ncbi:ferredoxin [Mycolicibacterium baixiangningiae]|uniref:ferredoxin n=1 Tax=Mycolicibacterium baixiangningiae TaxID=2761578 RepID=UPI0018663F86|nr:ferredoxin [Mycolicibacterium baixiangningiae]
MSVRPDNRLDDTPMAPVTCRACGADVLARKSSWQQTSVQWSAAAAQRCPQRQDNEALTSHGRKTVFLSCSELSESIAEAVRTGRLTIVDETVDAAP